MHHFVTEAHFYYKMVNCGIWYWCIVGFVQHFYLLLVNIVAAEALVLKYQAICIYNTD